ncbi:hypothetical protein GCM10023100_01300 [Actinocorallia cavernae]|uniref:Uncharacterized protein n=2 Tax=Actinomycetes TaxID=1760 RepID=A0ABP8S862_9ACTN
MRHGLVDEYRLTVHPVIIATGRRLFADGAIPTALEPVSVSTPKGGTVVGVYRPNGAVGVGSARGLREAGGEPGDRRGPPRCAARGRRPGRGGGGSAAPARARLDAIEVGEGFGQAEVSLAEGAGRLRGCGPVTSSG